jgi:hypothetical protein
MMNRPKDQLIGEPIRMGGKFVQAYQNPQTGKVVYEQIDLPFDLPAEYTNFQKMGDNLVAIPESWDGDVTKLKTIVGQKSTEDRLRETLLQKQIDQADRELAAPTKAEEAAAKSDEGKVKARALAQQATSAISNLKSMAGKSGAVGAGFQKMFLDKPAAGTAAAGFLTQLESVKSLVSLPNLEYMKGLGPMSEREFGAIQAASHALSGDISEKQFDTQVAIIEDNLDSVILRTTLNPGEILVRDKASGQKGALPSGEFDPSLYEQL